MDPSQYVDALISVEVKGGDVFQGRVSEIRPGEIPSVILKGAFKDGIPVREPITEINALDIKTLRIVEEAQKPVKSPQKPPQKEKKEKTSVASLIENKCTSPKNTKVTLLKRGAHQNDYGLSAEMSASCVVNESVKQAPEKEKKSIIPVELIPGAVFNGRKSDKSVLSKLFVNKSEKKLTQDGGGETSVKSGQALIDQLMNSDLNKRKSEEKQAFKKFGDFKHFTEKQQPDFNKFTTDRANSRKQKGPSGNPAKDQENGYKSRGRNKDLTEGLNLDDLNEDFDFTSNLELFDKDRPESKADDYDDPNVERPASRRNYRHDENIIDDPNRCTSWVQSKHSKPTLRVQPETLPHKIGPESAFTFQCHAKHTVVCENGAILPVVRRHDKEKYLEAAVKLFNDALYNVTIADRFTEYSLDVLGRHDVHPRHVVIVAGEDANVVMTHRVCQHLLNRKIPIILYSPPHIPGDLLDRVTVVRDVDALPTNPHVIYLLNPQIFHNSEPFRRWLMRTAKVQNFGKRERSSPKENPARVISLDFRVFDLQSMHTLMVGVADESIYNSHRKRSPSSQYTSFECCVADIGTPYEWFIAANSNAHVAFKKSLFVRLQNVS